MQTSLPPSSVTGAADIASIAAQWQDAAGAWARLWTQPLSGAVSPAAAVAAPVAAPLPAQDDTVARITRQYAERLGALWQATLAHAADLVPELAPGTGDRRFAAAEWHSVAYFSWLRQAWLIHADYVRA